MKYPRTVHLSNSPGVSKDDKVLESVDSFMGKEVVYSEKLDGECTSMTQDKIHARSEDSNHHPSQSWVKGFWATIKYKIPDNLQIVGESVYARHSIGYDRLNTFFYVFAVIDLERKVFLSWQDTLDLCQKIGLDHVPVLKHGLFDPKFDLKGIWSAFGEEIEGYVVRVVGEFPIVEMKNNMAKWVRAGHVKTDKHWRDSWKPNELLDNLSDEAFFEREDL